MELEVQLVAMIVQEADLQFTADEAPSAHSAILAFIRDWQSSFSIFDDPPKAVIMLPSGRLPPRKQASFTLPGNIIGQNTLKLVDLDPKKCPVQFPRHLMAKGMQYPDSAGVDDGLSCRLKHFKAIEGFKNVAPRYQDAVVFQ